MGKNSREAKSGGGLAEGGSLDWWERQEGKQKEKGVPQWDKLARTSERENVFISKPVEQRMPRTNQHVAQFACLKRKFHQLQKLWDFLGAYEQGFSPLGSLNWSANQSQKKKKQHFKGFKELRGLSLSQALTKHRQPCRHLWLWGPKGLKDVSGLFTTTHKSSVRTRQVGGSKHRKKENRLSKAGEADRARSYMQRRCWNMCFGNQRQ